MWELSTSKANLLLSRNKTSGRISSKGRTRIDTHKNKEWRLGRLVNKSIRSHFYFDIWIFLWNDAKMVNAPINVSTFPTDEIGVVTDINSNINQEYYEWLLKQHNYFPDCAFHKVSDGVI